MRNVESAALMLRILSILLPILTSVWIQRPRPPLRPPLEPRLLGEDGIVSGPVACRWELLLLLLPLPGSEGKGPLLDGRLLLLC